LKHNGRREGLDARASLNVSDYAVFPFLRQLRYATPMMISAVAESTTVLGSGTGLKGCSLLGMAGPFDNSILSIARAFMAPS
jgi:hypothetical protein